MRVGGWRVCHIYSLCFDKDWLLMIVLWSLRTRLQRMLIVARFWHFGFHLVASFMYVDCIL
jgi:hypothetical protein